MKHYHACTFAHSNRDKRNVLHFSFPSFRPLFKDASGTLDKSARFSALYRQDSNKLSNDDMLKLLADFRKLVMLLRVSCIINCMSGPADVLESFEHKMFAHICECGVCIYTICLC